jgi:small subunit ribosomal protein S8
MLSDPLADLLTRIRNAVSVNKKTVIAPYSQLKENLVKILVKHAYLKNYQVTGKAPHKNLEISLKSSQRKPTLTNLIRISKPGVRIYTAVADLNKIMRGRGLIILSTSQGIMTAKQAKQKNLGGEIICKVS